MRRCSAFRALTTWLTGMCRIRFQKRECIRSAYNGLGTVTLYSRKKFHLNTVVTFSSFNYLFVF